MSTFGVASIAAADSGTVRGISSTLSTRISISAPASRRYAIYVELQLCPVPTT